MCCHCQEELRKNASFWSILIHINYTYFRFVHSLSACLHQLCGYKALLEEIESLRSTSYNAENLEHEQSLLQLWSLLQPGVPLMTRKTKQWQNIGFQVCMRHLPDFLVMKAHCNFFSRARTPKLTLEAWEYSA